MPIDTKCPICKSMNEVYGSDCMGNHTSKRCVDCGAFLDPDFMKEELAKGRIKQFIWIGNDQYLGSGNLMEYVLSAIDKNKDKVYAIHTRVEKIERLKANGQTEKIIYEAKK